uniref:RRM domain-containing protein n=1 Tax=Sciurus vulgaris TaxID=55149 RepID=A0A8D2DH34_SCIVU
KPGWSLALQQGEGHANWGNLPTYVWEKDLEDLFYKYSRICKIELKNQLHLVPFAFEHSEDPQDVEDALYGRNSYDYGECRAGWPRSGRSGPPTRRSDFRVLVSRLPGSGSWQDLEDHRQEAGDVSYADVQKDGMGMVEYLRKEDMEYLLHNLDDTKFRSHEGETSYIRVYSERSTSYGYSQSPTGSRGPDFPYQSRDFPHYYAPFGPY